MLVATNITQLHEGTATRGREYHETINVQYFGDSVVVSFYPQDNLKLF
jgi:hypothetical protein